MKGEGGDEKEKREREIRGWSQAWGRIGRRSGAKGGGREEFGDGKGGEKEGKCGDEKDRGRHEGLRGVRCGGVEREGVNLAGRARKEKGHGEKMRKGEERKEGAGRGGAREATRRERRDDRE